MRSMLPIDKGSVPNELIVAIRRIKATPNTTLSWESLDGYEHRAVLRGLLKEQGGLCAYCTDRIDEDSAHIEHIVPQSAGAGSDDRNSVDYKNLLAVCDGFRGNAAGLTCDRARGNASLTVNPLKHETLSSIRYGRDGKISADDPRIGKDVQTTLNLNQELLKRNRNEAYRQLARKLQAVEKRRGVGAVTSFCRDYIDEHLANPEARIPYDGIVIYFMQKRLRRVG